MKKIAIFLTIFCVTAITARAQFLLEYTVDPVHIKDIRVGAGFFIPPSERIEAIVSYEYFAKAKDKIYQGVDLSLVCYKWPQYSKTILKHRANIGVGGRIGYVFDYGVSTGCLIKGLFSFNKYLSLSGQLGYFGVENWGFYPEGRIGLMLKFKSKKG